MFGRSAAEMNLVPFLVRAGASEVGAAEEGGGGGGEGEQGGGGEEGACGGGAEGGAPEVPGEEVGERAEGGREQRV